MQGGQGSAPFDYLSNLINKFNFDKFSMHVGQGIDFLLSEHTATNNYNTVGGNYYDPLYSHNNRVDLTFNFGSGYNITENFSVGARYKMGVRDAVDDQMILWFFSDINYNSVLQVGLTYKFNK